MSGHPKLLCRWTERRDAVCWIAILWAGVAAIGCRDDAAAQLEGIWIGRPAEAAKAAGPEASVGAQGDFQQFDAAVRMNFRSEQFVELELVGGGEPVRGEWEVVEATPGLLLIEIITPADPASAADAAPVRRRFELEPTYENDRLTRFDLREDGADRKLGSIRFQRATDVVEERQDVDAPLAPAGSPDS